MYLHDVLDSVKEEPNVLKRLSDTIIKYANMSDKELQEQIEGIDQDLKQIEQKKQFIIDVYNSRDVSRLVSISDDGKTITTITEPKIIIEDEGLKEKILSQLYFQEKNVSKERFGASARKICESIEQDNELSFGKTTPTVLDRKKKFSAMKVTARDEGYMILNSLDECESGENIPLRAVEIKNGEMISFQDLKSIYQKCAIDFKDKEWTQLYIKDRESGKEITDPQLVKMAKFASVWVGAAGTKWMADEELHGITYAFNEPSERLYNRLGELVGKYMTDNGMIDTQAIYEELSQDQYKHSEEIIRNILSNPANMSIVYEFYKMQNTEAKMETKLSKTSNEFVLGHTAEDFTNATVDEILEAIPDLDSTDARGQAQEKTTSPIQQQLQPDMVTLPNGVQIPKKQYDEEVMHTKANKKLDIKTVKEDIVHDKIAESEKQEQTTDMAEANMVKKIKQKMYSGELLTEEEKAYYEKNMKQRKDAQLIYQNQLRPRKDNGLEI